MMGAPAIRGLDLSLRNGWGVCALAVMESPRGLDVGSIWRFMNGKNKSVPKISASTGMANNKLWTLPAPVFMQCPQRCLLLNWYPYQTLLSH